MNRTVTAGSSLLLAAAVAACSSDTVVPPPLVPAHLEIVAGDQQSGSQGMPLAVPLEASVTALDGTPIVGMTVNWTVTSGGGSLSPTASTTNADGRASTIWTLGVLHGAQRATASIEWAGQPAFTATASASASSLLAIHYDGNTWSRSLEATDCCAELYSVWAASPNDVFAGGGSCGPFIVRYDGSDWGATPDCTTLGFNSVQAIAGTSPTDVFAAQGFGDPMEHGTSILHYDGQSWTTSYNTSCASTMCDKDVRGMWSRTSTDVFAVGDGGTILHYDGSAWTTQASGTTAGLSGVWGDEATGVVFAVGAAGTILRFNGTTWNSESSGTSQALYAIWGSSPTNIFAAGANGVILHYDGTSWSAMTTGTTRNLRAIWGSGSSVFAVGAGGTILHHDGTSWSAQTFSVPISLNGVWGTSPSNVFAVGGPS